MKKLIASLILCAAAFLPADSSVPADHHATEHMVWICVSPSAYAYHSTRDCKHLCRCRHSVRQVPLSQARELGKDKPCQTCH